jgi:hypothetical protein
MENLEDVLGLIKREVFSNPLTSILDRDLASLGIPVSPL